VPADDHDKIIVQVTKLNLREYFFNSRHK